jgi:hypothetical protein
MTWWVSIAPEVVEGIRSFGFEDPRPDRILESVEHYLAHYGEDCAIDRWDKCPESFFVYSHFFKAGGRWQTLELIVEDTSAAVGVLRVVWVEHHLGDPE